MAKDKLIALRAPHALIEHARLVAEQDGRSLSNYILRLIQADLAKQRASATQEQEHNGSATHAKRRAKKAA